MSQQVCGLDFVYLKELLNNTSIQKKTSVSLYDNNHFGIVSFWKNGYGFIMSLKSSNDLNNHYFHFSNVINRKGYIQMNVGDLLTFEKNRFNNKVVFFIGFIF